MSLLQEMEKHGLADCEFNRALLKREGKDMREKLIERLVWDDIDTMIKDAERGDFFYFSEVLKNRSPYKEWSDEELLNEFNERDMEVIA